MNSYLILALLLYTSLSTAQIDTTSSNFLFGGYAEVYYAYDFNQPEDHNRPSFMYSHDRHNEVNLNLGFLKASYINAKVRANLAVAAGTYINANYASEPGLLMNIYEANAGVKICRRNNVWLDAGIFSSHIGFESAVSKDCWGLTRSLSAENSPYYEAGVKLSVSSLNNKWFLSGLLLNGWQHIQRPESNNTPAFGTQVTYVPNEKFTLNYSTFIGNDKPDTSKQIRYFNNFYSMIHLTDHFHVTAGFDYGLEQESEGSSEYNHWYSPVVLVKVIMDDVWSFTARGEYYVDEHGVIIPTGTVNGFRTVGYSLNVDYRIRENAVWKIEGRLFKSKDDIFIKNGDPQNSDLALTTSLAVSF